MVRRRFTKKQTTSRPDYLWPEIWKDMSEAAARKEKQKWPVEKPKLDNARRLRGIYIIDPEDAEFKPTRSFWKQKRIQGGNCLHMSNIKMIIKGRSPMMRHVSRTHEVALDWLVDRINLDHMIQIKYVETENQLADL